MSDWIEQYSAALTQRDAREQAHKPYIDAYTRLADQTAATQPPQPREDRTGTPTKSKPTTTAATTTPLPTDLLSTLRTDLATTQKARTALQTRLDDLILTLTTLRTQSQTSTTQIAALTRQKTDLERKLRDREEELRGKTRLAEQAQDEMVALGLQMNMAEQRAEKLREENVELVERWMKRMGEEADRVNRDSRWE